MAFAIFHGDAKSILSPTRGFIADAGFTHSLSPARNCGFACSYCYVPTMRFQGGLKPEDWRNWGAFTTFKSNAAELLDRALRPEQSVYCSPLVDPYQPAEEQECAMPPLLDALCKTPPRAFALQTRGPLILRDLDRLARIRARTRLRVSFSITTDRDEIRKLYEPMCAPIGARIEAIRRLRAAGIAVHATLAPLLPCNPEALLDMALEATSLDVIGDPFHSRMTKTFGATTRDAAVRLSARLGLSEWHDPGFQAEIVGRLRSRAASAGRKFEVGTEGFRILAEDHS